MSFHIIVLKKINDLIYKMIMVNEHDLLILEAIFWCYAFHSVFISMCPKIGVLKYSDVKVLKVKTIILSYQKCT